MGESSFFTRADCVNALDRNEGNVEKALLELEVKALEPIRKRVLRQLDVEDARTRSAALNQVYEQVVKNVNVSAEVSLSFMKNYCRVSSQKNQGCLNLPIYILFLFQH